MLHSNIFLMVPSVSMADIFDGTWKVKRTGITCTPTGTIKVSIEKNQFSGSYVGASGKHIIKGTIKSSGKFQFIATSKFDEVIFKGKIEDKKGKGNWSVKGRTCGGSLKIGLVK